MTSLILCQGDKCPIRIYCLRYVAMSDPYQDIRYYVFDSDNLWCDYFIVDEGGEETNGEKERKGKGR